MKRTFTLTILALVLAGAQASVKINSTNFPDETFRALLAEYDSDGDGSLSTQEMEEGFNGIVNIAGVTNLKGIELLTPLTDVSILYPGTDEPSITAFDYALPNLEGIEFFSAGNLTAIDLTRCPKLTRFAVTADAPKLSSLKLPAGITSFLLDGGPGITTFDPKQFPDLQWFTLYARSGITDLDFSNHKVIESISVQGEEDGKNQLKTLVMNNCPSLANIDIKNAAIKSLTFQSLPEMRSLLVYSSDIVEMLVQDLPELGSIEAHDNDLGTLTMYKLPIIGGLQCEDNRLQTLIIDECPQIGDITARNNRLMWLDLSGVKKGNHDENGLRIDNQQPAVQAVKLSPTETGLRVHPRFDVSRVLNLRAKGIAQTPKEIYVDGIRYFVFYDNGPDTPNLVGSDCFYEYQTKWPYAWVEGNSKDNNLPVTLNVTSWTKHQAMLTLSESVVHGRYAEPAPKTPIVTRSQDYDGKITFSSNNEKVVKVNPDTGELTVVGAGTAVITVSGAETDYRLPPVTAYSVVIEKASPTFTFEKAELNAIEGQEAPANPLDIQMYDGTVIYTSSNDSIATVNAQGIVTANVPGQVAITATGHETANCNQALEAHYTLIITDASGIGTIGGQTGTGRHVQWYDLQGRKADAPRARKGIYVTDGRKVLKD